MQLEVPISTAGATNDRSKQDAYAPILARLLPPKAASLVEERRRRKERLAGGLRIFAALGFAEGVAGHITARDPEFADTFWVNPFGMGFDRIRVSDLIRVDARGEVVEGSGPLNVSAFAIHAKIHEARPEVIAAAHAHSVNGKAWSAVGRLLDPITQDACAFYEDHVFFDDTESPDHRRKRRRATCAGARRQQGRDPAQPWPDHGRPDRRRGRLVVRVDGAVLSDAVSRRVDLQAVANRPRERPRDALDKRRLRRRVAPMPAALGAHRQAATRSIGLRKPPPRRGGPKHDQHTCLSADNGRGAGRRGGHFPAGMAPLSKDGRPRLSLPSRGLSALARGPFRRAPRDHSGSSILPVATRARRPKRWRGPTSRAIAASICPPKRSASRVLRSQSSSVRCRFVKATSLRR